MRQAHLYRNKEKCLQFPLSAWVTQAGSRIAIAVQGVARRVGAGVSEAGVNIWALDKDQNLRHLLLLLQEQLGSGAFRVDSQTRTDVRAIYLRDPLDNAMAAYLYTVGQPHGRYGVHLEYPEAAVDANRFNVHENLSFRALADLLAIHFSVNG